MKNGKLVTYLGFCIRARNIVFGVDDIDAQRKGVFVLLCDNALGASSVKTLQKAKERLGCPVIAIRAGMLGEYLNRPAVKAVGIKDKNLASAILKEAENEQDWIINSELYSGGVN
ncbi:MAG: hypothetical protein IJX88_04000 [Clostridia bacterium]|nr:hypothetical protein [Clostridia bacterium]